ncbi:MAG: hypothetical protein U0R19_05435 [Bryobacteraceae bacterium]
MSRVEEIELRVKALNEDELRAFREWFAEYDAEAWDREIEAHAADGTLARLAEKALRDHEQGLSTEL